MNRPDIPLDFARAILRCLAKKPGDRFPDLPAFAVAIAPFGAKGADELALRVSRARKGKTDEARPSGPSLIAPAATPSSSEETLSVLAETEVGDRPVSRADARTAATWTGPQPGLRTQRRATRAVGFGFATLAAVAGLALWRARLSSTDSDVTVPSPASLGTETATAPSASPTPTAAPQTAGPAPSSSPEAGAVPLPRKGPPPVVKKSPPAAPTPQHSPPPSPQPSTPPSTIEDQRKN
jgi:hypothetical protein